MPDVKAKKIIEFENIVNELLVKYRNNFSCKEYPIENNDYDVLMNIYHITPKMKRENRQYWGRELGMLWQYIVTAVFRSFCTDKYKDAIKYGSDEPCDLYFNNDAIDTKYRIGSGDSGTLKKFKYYADFLKERGYTPILLILRTDNLRNALNACSSHGWEVLQGNDSFQYIFKNTQFDLEVYLNRITMPLYR